VTFERPESTAMTTTEPTPTTRDRWFTGTLLRILATADDTNGQLGVFEQHAPGGFSPPRHVHHREDTALYVIEGTITVVIGETRRQVTTGGLAWLPRDIPHTFRVESDHARLLELITPGGFEMFHVDAGDPAESLCLPPSGEPDISRLVSAIGPYDAEIVGPPLGPND
jgi:quercetin dioxygenase-like cupin family protein